MKEGQKTILVVEDEKNISEAIKVYLLNENYHPIMTNNGLKGLEFFETFKPDLVILDLMLPNLSGEEICTKIRRVSRVPIIILTAKNSDDDKVNCFDIGADDYLAKPFSPRELVARIKSLLRRSEASKQPLYNIMTWNNNDLEINFDSLVVKKKGIEVSLTPNEFKILSLLVKYPNRVFSRDNIIALAFDNEYEGFDRTIDSHIKNLRAKIEDEITYIITVRGLGYRFSPEELSS